MTRFLFMNLDGVLEKFWDAPDKFFEVLEAKKMIRVELPRIQAIVELSYDDKNDKENMVDALLGAKFIQYETRVSWSLPRR